MKILEVIEELERLLSKHPHMKDVDVGSIFLPMDDGKKLFIHIVGENIYAEIIEKKTLN